MSIRYNSGEDWFKHPFGAVKCNTEVTFRIVAEGNPFAVFLVANGEKIPGSQIAQLVSIR